MESSDPGVPLAHHRVAWVDYAKGICIVLVVMLHATLLQHDRGGIGWMGHVVAFARPFRMPDFFLIAGLFLTNTIDRPWRTFLDKKVLHFGYLYVLWATLGYVLFVGRGALKDGQSWQEVAAGYPMILVDPIGSLWFIHSLALYFLVARLTRRVPWWLMLALCAALQSLPIATGWFFTDEFARRFVYFYAGFRLAPQVFRLAEWATSHRAGLLAYLGVWGVLNQLLVAAGLATLPGVSLGLGFCGAIAVVFTGVLLSQLPGTGALRYLGANSLAVYLGYYVSLRLAAKVSAGLIHDAGTAALVLTLACILGALALRWATVRAGLAFLYHRPAWAHLASEPRRPRARRRLSPS
jgi:uncharacterized membrane protein YcfT